MFEQKDLAKEQFTATFSEEKEFQQLLEFMRNNDKHVVVKIPKLKVVANSTLPATSQATEGDDLTGLSLIIDGKPHYILESALPSLKRRSELDTSLMKKLSPKEAEEFYNVGFSKQGKFATNIFLRGDKAQSVLAMHSERYVSISQADVYSALTRFLHDNFDSVEFSFASYEHDFTKVKLTVEDENVTASYKKALSKAGIKADVVMFEPVLCMSDTGYSSVSIGFNMLDGNKVAFPFIEPVHIPHRDQTTFKDVETAIENLFVMAREGLGNLERLISIKLSCPSSVAKKLAKKYKLPSPLIDTILPNFQLQESFGEEISALDFYRYLCVITDFPKFREYPEKRQFETRCNLAKISFLSDSEWAKLDRP